VGEVRGPESLPEVEMLDPFPDDEEDEDADDSEEDDDGLDP